MGNVHYCYTYCGSYSKNIKEMGLLLRSRLINNCKKLIIAGLKDEYEISKRQHHKNNIKQIYFLIMGSILIYLSFKIKASGDAPIHPPVWGV